MLCDNGLLISIENTWYNALLRINLFDSAPILLRGPAESWPIVKMSLLGYSTSTFCWKNALKNSSIANLVPLVLCNSWILCA